MDRPPLSDLKQTLLTREEPISKRIRTVFYLRSEKTQEAAEVLEAAIGDPSDLLKHELCYALGQMGLKSSVPFLCAVVRDQAQATIVRHEAAEALGAIGDAQGRAALEEFQSCEIRELGETCHLALKRMEWLQTGEHIPSPDFTVAIDPAPAFPPGMSLDEVTRIYNDPDADLFLRYRALFTLRNICTPESLLILAQGLVQPNFSPLFKHEIAFVLGELSEKAESTAKLLEAAVEDRGNHCMVRHEASEALSEVRQSAETADFLRRYLADESDVVRESCEVALDILQYWTNQTEV